MAAIIKKCEHTTAQRRSCKHNWVVRYRDSGGKQRETSYLWNQKEQANGFALDVESKKKQGDYVDPKQSAVKFGDAADKWINRAQLSTGTKANYRSLLDIHLLPAIGNMSLAALNSQRGREVVETLLTETLPAEPNPLGSARVKIAYIVIKGVINDAVKRGVFPSSRISGITLGEKSARAEFIFPAHKQLKVMADAMPEEYRLVVWLMRGCGLRLGEALGVSKSDFRAGGVLRVHEQQLAKLGYGPLKHRRADEYRDVPVPAYVAQMVATHQAQPDGRLFAPVWHYTYSRWFGRAAKAAGISEDFTPHKLRHIFASVCLANGVPITDVSAWLGHKDINTTYAIYGHLVPSSFDRAKNVLDAEYEEWSTDV